MGARVPPWPEAAKEAAKEPIQSAETAAKEAAKPAGIPAKEPAHEAAKEPPVAPPIAASSQTKPPAAEPAKPAEVKPPTAIPRPTSSPLSAPALSPAPKFATATARERSSEFEQKLGTNWLNKIGITILVIGISLFLAIKFPSLSNPAKIALGYAIGLAILGTGVYLEKKERYKIFARALIGGGWALTFFTTYAMHFVTYTRVIETQWIDLVLLFVVAGAMVAHTLRYDSQVVTGLAFLLAFTTVAISQNTIYSLSAGVILALGLVAIVHRRGWYELEIFGILASYLNHFVWLARVIVPMAGHHRMFPEFVPSSVLLCLYWAVYRWSYVSRKIVEAKQETVSTVAAILNTALLLFLFKYQSVHKEYAFYALIALGVAELVVAHLPVTRRRRAAFVILSSIGTVLLVAAIPFKYSGMDTAIIWLAQAQILLIAGVAQREALFRRFGFLVALLTSGDMLINQAFPSLFGIVPLGLPLSLAPARGLPDWQLSLSFLVAAALFYANSLVIPRRWKEIVATEMEETFYRALSYLAAALLFVGLWLAFPSMWIAVAWAGAALGVLLLGRAVDADDLVNQTHLFAVAAFVRAVMVNSLSSERMWQTGATLRLVTLTAIIALLYLCARWVDSEEAGETLRASELYTTAAAILVMVLAYQECHWAWIGIVWGGFALVLALLGLAWKRRDLSLQANLMVLAGFGRVLVYNLEAAQEYGHFTLRLITFVLMAVLLYACAYFSGPRDSAYGRLFSALDSFAGTILVSVLAFKEISSPWIAVAWALFAFLLVVVAGRVKRAELHVQAYILSALSLFQLVTVNLDAAQPFRWIPSVTVRLVTFVLVAALFYLCSCRVAKAEFIGRAEIFGALYAWAGFVGGDVVVACELAGSRVALGWVLFAVALMELGIWRRSVNWRAQGYVVFVLAFMQTAVTASSSPQKDLLAFTLPVAALLYYGYARMESLTKGASEDFAFDTRIQGAAILAFLGSGTLLAFAEYYFEPKRMLVAFAVLALLWIGVAWGTRKNVWLYQSMLLTVFTFLRALAVEYDVSWMTTPAGMSGSGRAKYVGITAAILFACQGFAFLLRKRFESGEEEEERVPELLRRPEQLYFFLPVILVTLLILEEVSTGRVTIYWGIEGLAIFLFALAVGERSFRLTGLGLLLVCVGKVVALDVWRQQRSDRYITFITLGVALLLVSFLYTKFSETIRRYL